MLNTLIRLAPGPVRRLVARRMPMLSQTVRYARAAAAETGRTPLHHFREARSFLRHRGIGPSAYYYYRLFDPTRSPEERAAYIPDDRDTPEARALRNFQRVLTASKYRLLFNNKLVADRFFRNVGLPLPRIYGVFDPEVGFALGGAPLRTVADLRAWMEAFEGEGFVFKPLEGGFGCNVTVLARRLAEERGLFLSHCGERYDAERLVASTRDPEVREFLYLRDHDGNQNAYLLQEHLRPHPAVAALTGGPTLCSVRIQTYVDVAGTARLLAAAFKLQADASSADNLTQGAVACWVDPEHGTLERGRFKIPLTDIVTVPGTNRPFIGFQLPDWPQAREMALSAAAAFPWARSIGWDIALSDRGPMLLEGNDLWGPAILQLAAPGGLLTGDFKALYESLNGTRRCQPKR